MTCSPPTDPDAREALITQALPFVVWAVRRWTRGRVDPDLVQEGILGLCRAAARYDSSRGVWFIHAARPWVFGAIRRASDRDAEARLACLFRWPDHVLLDAMEGPGDYAAAVEVRDLVESLPRRHAEVIRRRYGLDGLGGASQAAVGRALGLAQSTVSQIEAEALDRLRAKVARSDMAG